MDFTPALLENSIQKGTKPGGVVFEFIGEDNGSWIVVVVFVVRFFEVRTEAVDGTCCVFE